MDNIKKFLCALEQKHRDKILTGVNDEKTYIFKHREEILNRASILDNNSVTEVIKLILHHKATECYGVLKKEIEGSLMGYETDLKMALKDWTKKDFEELYSALYGQSISGKK